MPWVEKEEDEEDIKFISFIKNYKKASRPVVVELLKKYADKNIVIFHTREDSHKYLEKMKKTKINH